MKQAFKSINFRSESLGLIEECCDITEQYMQQGLRLSLRQLYYVLVSANRIPNTERSYKKLGSLVSNARLAGLIDWDAIEDRVRRPRREPEWSSIQSLVNSALYSFRLPRLQGQNIYVETWTEKDAIAGVLSPLTSEYHVVLMVNRGYSSQSAMYEAANRINYNKRRYGSLGSVVLYLGDLDPSGEDMVRDIQDRLTLFGCGAEVEGCVDDQAGTSIQPAAQPGQALGQPRCGVHQALRPGVLGGRCLAAGNAADATPCGPGGGARQRQNAAGGAAGGSGQRTTAGTDGGSGVKIYVVAVGVYSDYSIVGLYTDIELAKRCCRYYNPDLADGTDSRSEFRIEEYEVNSVKPDGEIPKGLRPWRIYMTRDGTYAGDQKVSVCEVRGGRRWILLRVEGKYQTPMTKLLGSSTFIETTMLARDEKHAVKIANERRAQLIALGRWPAEVDEEAVIDPEELE